MFFNFPPLFLQLVYLRRELGCQRDEFTHLLAELIYQTGK